MGLVPIHNILPASVLLSTTKASQITSLFLLPLKSAHGHLPPAKKDGNEGGISMQLRPGWAGEAAASSKLLLSDLGKHTVG